MKEPSIFYSERGLQDAFTKIDSLKGKNLGVHDFFQLKDTVNLLSNNEQDYKNFYNNVNGKTVLHNDVHIFYGYYMTRAAAEGFDLINPIKRFLLFSRFSPFGMHRYVGLWTGGNCSWLRH